MHKFIIAKPSSGSTLVVEVAIITGLLASLVITNISRLLKVWEDLGVGAVALVVFVLIGWLIEYTAPMNTKFKNIIRYASITCLTIAPGVIIDATLDSLLRHYDRNLFPFEIIIWWVFAPLPLLAGVMLGRAFFEFKLKNNN